MQGRQVSEQDRNVYCSFICSHAVRHTRSLLRSLGKHWHETCCDWHVKMSAVHRACRQIQTCVSVCMCMTAFGVCAACVLSFDNVSACMRVDVCLLCTELPKWQVRTLMSGNWDTQSLTNNPCQKEDPNNVPQLLYYSVFALGVMLLKSSTP